MRKTRSIPTINAGSMADIAFLLLIFFLVSTEIYDDRGLSVSLPAFYEGPVGLMAERNVCVIRINSAEKVLLEGVIMDISQIKDAVKAFIMNDEKEVNRPLSPKQAVISIQHDVGINYKVYMQAYTEIKAAYRELYNEFSMSTFGRLYNTLSTKDKNVVREAIPLKISEAEY